jgi:glycosyltransferase involved in cell wall biosynthesis
VKFLLIGNGEWRERFEQLASEPLFRGHFVFTGLVPPERIPVLLGATDVVAHLSRREGLARALPQALAAGRPVVAYDCDGAREVCLEGETGCLVRPGDIPALVENLLSLAHNPNLRRQMGQRGRDLVRACFSERGMVERLAVLYRNLAAQKAARKPSYSP